MIRQYRGWHGEQACGVCFEGAARAATHRKVDGIWQIVDRYTRREATHCLPCTALEDADPGLADRMIGL